MSQSALQPNEFVWDIKDDEWDQWRKASHSDYFKTKDFELCGVIWSISCYPNGNTHNDFVCCGKSTSEFMKMVLEFKSAQTNSVGINGSFTCDQFDQRKEFQITVENAKNTTDCRVHLINNNNISEMDCDQLTIKFQIQAILQTHENDIDWVIMQEAVNISTGIVRWSDRLFRSPKFKTPDENQWYITFNRRNFEYFNIELSLDDSPSNMKNKKSAFKYTMGLAELNTKHHRSCPFYHRSSDASNLCRLDEIQNMKQLTIQCKITPLKETAVDNISDSGLNWEISGNEMERLKTGHFGDSFVSPMFKSDDALWYLILDPNEYKGTGVIYPRPICVSFKKYYLENQGVRLWSKLECEQLNYMDIICVEYHRWPDKNLIHTAVWDPSQLNKLESITIKCNMQSNRKVWIMKKDEMKDNEIEFELNDLKWKMKTTNNSIQLKLIEATSGSNTKIQRTIICEKLGISDRKTVTYSDDAKENDVIYFDDNKDDNKNDNDMGDDLIAIVYIINSLRGIPSNLMPQ
eukprot:90715_1